MTDKDDKDRQDDRDGIEKVFDSVADAFNKFTQKPEKVPQDKAAFFRAVRQNKVAEVAKFIAAGIDLDATGAGGDTALHLAARNNLTQVAKLLLEAGANPRAAHGDDPKRTPLADAVNFGKVEMAELLTRAGGYTPGETASNGFTLLHRACEKGNPKLVEAMISAGADSNERTGNGATPLIVAIVQRQLSVAERLLDFPAVAHGINEFFVNTDPKKRTAFHLAVEKGQSALVARMLDFGSNVNAPDADGVTPLEHAILRGELALVKTLVTHGADLNKPGNGARTPLFLACKAPEITDGKLRAEIVAFLLQAGADPEIADPATKLTPLHAAVLSATGKETVAALLKYPLNKDAPDDEGSAPIFYAVAKTAPDILRALLDAGADPNARQMDDARTPLIQAVQERSVPGVALLLSRGANPKLYDAHGKSALSYARAGDMKEIIPLLEAALEKKPSRKGDFKEWTL